MLVEIGRKRPRIGRIWPTYGYAQARFERDRSRSVLKRPNSARARPTPGQIWPNSIGRARPVCCRFKAEFGRVCPKIGPAARKRPRIVTIRSGGLSIPGDVWPSSNEMGPILGHFGSDWTTSGDFVRGCPQKWPKLARGPYIVARTPELGVLRPKLSHVRPGVGQFEQALATGCWQVSACIPKIGTSFRKAVSTT